MNHQCFRCQGELLPGTKQCPTCGMTFEQPVPGVAAAPVTPAPTSVGGETTRLEQMAQALRRKIEVDRAKPTRRSRLDEFLAARKGVQTPDSLAAEPQKPMVVVRRVGAILFGSRRRVATTAILFLAMVGVFIFTYDIWDSVFTSHSSSGYDQPTVAQAQAAFATDIPVTPAAPAASQAAPPDDLSRFMPPPLPARQAAAPPVQQAAPVPVQQAAAAPAPPQGGDPNMVARMVERGFQEDREARQTQAQNVTNQAGQQQVTQPPVVYAPPVREAAGSGWPPPVAPPAQRPWAQNDSLQPDEQAMVDTNARIDRRDHQREIVKRRLEFLEERERDLHAEISQLEGSRLDPMSPEYTARDNDLESQLNLIFKEEHALEDELR